MSAGPVRPSRDLAIGLCLTAALVVLAFVTTGGFDQALAVSAATTWAEIVITLLGAGACVAMLVLGAHGPAWGAVTVALFALLTAFTALSIAWSVQPDDSWQAASLTLAYLAAFAGGASLARLAPERWRVLVAAIAVTSVVLSGYALLAKVFPASLDAGDTQGRLQAPLGYWNATGMMGALGLAPCLWAWTRRDLRSVVLRGLTVPAAAVLIAVVVLSYSRSAVLVALLALGCWLAIVSGRLRAVAMLALSAAGAAVIAGWALSKPALTGDNQGLAARTAAGHTFGVVILASIVVLTAAGVGAGVGVERIAIRERLRRRIGTGIVILAALLPVAAVVALATSSRGLTGEVSHAWSSLTSVNSGVGDSASRIGQLGSSRPLYWGQGITVGEHALLKGVGALGYGLARTRYTTDTHVAEHAHSFVVQTFADLGLIGLVISLALLIAWCLSAARALALRMQPPLGVAAAAEHEGLIALALVVLTFGVQSAIDWTWFFPGVTVPVLLCAGWLAGRGPLARPIGAAKRRASILSRPAVAASVTAVVALALLGAWMIWQPLRSADAVASAETAAAHADIATAFSDAREAVGADPLALQPLLVLSELYQAVGDERAARAQLLSAVDLQPQNYASWLALGSFDLRKHRPRLALASLERALALAPTTEAATIQAVEQARAELVS